MAKKGEDDKSRRLQSLDQDVLALEQKKQQQDSRPSGGTRQQAVAPAGAPPAGGGGGSSTGMVVTVSILSVLLIFTIAAGVLYGLYIHEQMKGMGEGPDIAGQQAPLEQRLGELESRVDNLAQSSGDSDVSADVLNWLDALESEMAGLRPDVDSVRGRIVEVAQQSKKAVSTAEQVSSAVSTVKQTLSTHGNRLDDLSSRLSELNSLSGQQDVSSQVQHLNGRVEKLSDDIDSIYRILESQ